MKKILPIFILHILLLVLAATNFTILSWLWGKFSWQCNYFSYQYKNGWGYSYVSDYSWSQALVYLAGYVLGFPVFLYALNRQWYVVGWCGVVFSILGVISFTIEASHWFIDHHLSWIVSFPGVMAVLWIDWGFRAWETARIHIAPEPERLA